MGGVPLVTAVVMLVFGVTVVVMYRRAIEVGADPLMAFAVTFGAYVVMLVHAMARPHHVTYLCFALILYELERFRAGEIGPRRLWWIPLVLVPWTNLHGGFVVGFALLGLYLVAEVVGWAWGTEGATLRRVAALGVTAAAALVATLANPFGWRLHLQIREYLGYQTASLFSEFQSPQFHRGQVCETTFEAGIVITLLLLACGKRKLPLATGLALAYFLAQGLQSARHMVLFAIAAAPTLSLLATDLLRTVRPTLAEAGEVFRRTQRELRGDWVWAPVAAVAFVALSFHGEPWFRREIVGLRVSAGAIDYIRAHPADFGRMFNGEDTGGTLAYALWPAVKIYIDDRLNGYGERFFRENFLPIVELDPSWQSVLDRNGVTSAVVSRSARYVALWRDSPNWREAYADDTSVLYLRRTPLPTAAR